jgi:hypothetical protein
MKRAGTFARLTFTLTRATVERLHLLRLRHGVAASGIVELALRSYFQCDTEMEVAERLKAAGVAKRR